MLIRLLCILAGALAFSFLVAKVVLVPVGQWYEMNKVQSFDDVSEAFVVALVVQAIFAVVGGSLGDRAFRKWRHKELGRQQRS
jgi:high-affinity K+ transport system ATPase subunit B